MKKIKILLNYKRPHFWNRLKLRKGNLFYFLLAKIIDKKGVADKECKSDCLVWQFKNHLFLTQNDMLQTYIKK
jgi:hypothetical protein